MKKLMITAALCFCVLGAKAQETYTNPVLPENCPDPTVLDDRERSGWFYLYSTQTTMDGDVKKDSSPADKNGGSVVVNLPIYRSRDLQNWEFVGDGFPQGRPSWVKDSKLWAPDINYFDGKYVLYYALGVWGKVFREGSGVAVSDSPAGPFTDYGKVVDYKSLGTLNSIDPNYFDDGDAKYLYWGSLGGGINVIRLADDGLSVKDKTAKKHISARNMEAAYMHKRDGWYYLFASKGSCCKKENSTYHIVVARSKSPMGPFRGPDGEKFTSASYSNVILQAVDGGSFIGPGHNAEIITDKDGRDWMLYHSYWKGNGYNGRLLNLDEIRWDEDGWPYFVSGTPSGGGRAPRF